MRYEDIIKRMEEIENVEGFIYYDYLRFKDNPYDKYIDHNLDDLYLEYNLLEVWKQVKEMKMELEV